MAKFASTQNNFSSGCLSSKLYGRNDIAAYKNGARVLDNFIALKSGGVYKRPPLFGLGNPGNAGVSEQLNTCTAHRVSGGVFFLGRTFSGDERSFTAKESNGGLSNFVDISTAGISTGGEWNSYVIGDITVFTSIGGINPPFYIQKFGSIYTAKPWLVETKVGSLRIPFKKLNNSPDSNIIIGSDIIFSGIDADDIGKYFIYNSGGSPTTRIFKVTGATTVAPIDGGGLISGDTANWYVSEWGGSNGWPTHCTMHRGRLVFNAGTAIVSSKSNNIFHLRSQRCLTSGTTVTNWGDGYNSVGNGDTLATDPLSISIDDSEKVEWIASTNQLLVGTREAEYIVNLESSDPFAKAQSFTGSSSINPVRLGNSIFYVGNDKRSVYQFSYSEENGGYISRNLSILNDEYIPYQNEVKRLTVVVDKSLILIDCGQENTLYALVVDQSGGTVAWSRLKSDMFAKEGQLNSIFQLSNTFFHMATSTAIDECVVSSWNINKDYYQYDFEPANDPGDAYEYRTNTFYVDNISTEVTDNAGTLEYSVSNMRGTYQGLARNQTWFQNNTNYNVIYVKQVNGITSPQSAVAGIPVKAEVETMSIDKGSRIGDALSLFTKIVKAVLHVSFSKGGRLGDSKLFPIGYPKNLIASTKAASINLEDRYSGPIVVKDISSNSKEDYTFKVISDDGHPMVLNSISFLGVTEE